MIVNKFLHKLLPRFPDRCCFFKRYAKTLPVDYTWDDDLPVHKLPAKSPNETMVYGWGLADHGALGSYMQKRKKMNGRTDLRFSVMYRPLRLTFGELHSVSHIAAGYGFSAFAVRSHTPNMVYGTGLNSDSQIGYHSVRANAPLELLTVAVPIHLGLKNPEKTKIINISAGRAHLVVVTDLEGIFTLGNNAYGQCGRKIIENEEYSGSRIVHNIKKFKDDPVKSVECGQDHTLFLTESGKVYACGWGADGQTGLGHYNSESQPTRVLGDIENEKIVKISAKCDCVLAINDKGDVFGWGNSEYAQFFEKTASFQQLNRPAYLKKCHGYGKIVDVAAGGSHCMMLNDAGDVFTWGYGILGQGPTATQSWKPQIIPPILFGRNEFAPDSKVLSVYCGLNHNAAITTSGDVYTWGKNRHGCLGSGEKEDIYFPWRVSIGGKAKKMALGVDHTLAMCKPFG